MRPQTRSLLGAISELATCNPFSPKRFALERKILGRECEPLDSIAWNRTTRGQTTGEADRPNVIRLTQLAADVVDEVVAEKSLPAGMEQDYWAVANYLLLYRHITQLDTHSVLRSDKPNKAKIGSSWQGFWCDYQRIFDVDAQFHRDQTAAVHQFAFLTQVHRAFFNIFDHILGSSQPITRLREQVWESIFTCCMFRYHSTMFDRMRDLATLITGPSGTGKELVARAIGLSQFVPFDAASGQFLADHEELFLPLNLSALSPTLIESELFGHRKGAFTGAVVDRKGWLETCSPYGAVFLDEIGELDLELQVKLLRVLQQRKYHRLGDTVERSFTGKIIAATNRDLESEISEGRFREDFYFRICTDRIKTPTLQQQLANQPSDLEWLVESIVGRQVSEQVESLSSEITQWIRRQLGDEYPWHGNIRELEQCVASYLIRQEYVPLQLASKRQSACLPDWLAPAVDAEITAEDLTRRYCTWVYSQQGSYEQTARIVKLDRRTVKAKVDDTLLEQLRGS